MSWHYLPELAAGCSEADCSAGVPSAPWKKSRIAEKCSSDASGTVCLTCSQSGTTSEPSTASPGVESWISSLAASRAQTCLSPETEPGSAVLIAGSGSRCSASFARFDHDSRSWKTPQRLLLGGLEQFSETWPESGLMLRGDAFQLAPLERPISAKGSGLWPTPNTNPGRPCEGNVRMLRAKVLAGELTEDEAAELLHGGKSPFEAQGKIPAFYEPTPRVSGRDNCGGSNARKAAKRRGVYAGRSLNPEYQEWLMGWPIGWTGLAPLEMAKFLKWCASHGIS
jgi:hypothetical protein